MSSWLVAEPIGAAEGGPGGEKEGWQTGGEGCSAAERAPHREDGRLPSGRASVSRQQKQGKEIDFCVLLGQGYFGPFR